jgi:hypothetical protein
MDLLYTPCNLEDSGVTNSIERETGKCKEKPDPNSPDPE